MPRGRVKSSPVITGSLASSLSHLAFTHSHHTPEADRALIERTLETYIEAWFKGDAAAMERCLHPELTARLLQAESPVSEAQGIHAFPRSQGIQAILGTCTHPLSRQSTITVLDISGHSASARADLGDWVAYMHLAFTGDRWAIVNVLWEWRTSRDRRSA